jgi:oligoendopeptidase F
MSYEIMGVSLLDMKVWTWMYAHPDATPAQLKETVISIAKEVWNKYYAEVLGVKDCPILAIYSHMIDSPLYLPNYPIGHLIDFQLDQWFKGKNFGDETIRIYSAGKLIPQEWMKHAVGSEISTKPMIEAADAALKVVK